MLSRAPPASQHCHTLRVPISLAKQTASVHSSHYHVCALCALQVLFHIEYDPAVEACNELWQAQHGVTPAFIAAHPEGVTWGCDVCDATNTSTAATATAVQAAAVQAAAVELCATCTGMPAAHPECHGLRFAQTFESIPRAMWFLTVTVTTVGFGDVAPATWIGASRYAPSVAEPHLLCRYTDRPVHQSASP